MKTIHFLLKEEHTWIEEYFLPTYFEPEFFIKENHHMSKSQFWSGRRYGRDIQRNGLLFYADVQKSYRKTYLYTSNL